MKTILKKLIAFVFAAMLVISTNGVIFAENITLNIDVTIDTVASKRLISPSIYGITDTVDNSKIISKSIKQGGNRFSTYNWETNYSNWGSEQFHINDDSLVSGYADEKKINPGLSVSELMARAYTYNIPTVGITIPIGDYVAADKNGPVLDTQSAPSSRWIPLYPIKNSPFSLTPNKVDDAVYIDEYIYNLTQIYLNSQTSSLKVFFLDNEPDLWFKAHPTLYSDYVKCSTLIDKSVGASEAIKTLNDGAVVAGGCFSGIKGCASFGDAIDWNNYYTTYNWYIDYYLDNMKKASGKNRIIDMLDVHYYSEHAAIDQHNVTDCNDLSHTSCQLARMQAPRTLWDGTFIENSDIYRKYKQYLPLIPSLQASINTYYPGTKLSLSEYNFGGGNHISGGIAQADALGIFARENVYMANLNTSSAEIDYQICGMNLYTNYDGNGSTFGNTYVNSEISDNENSSIYTSIQDGNDNTLKIVLINKSEDKSENFNINIESNSMYSSGEVYGFNSSKAEIIQKDDIKSIRDNIIDYTIGPMSAVIIVLNGQTMDSVNPSLSNSSLSENQTNISETEDINTSLNSQESATDLSDSFSDNQSTSTNMNNEEQPMVKNHEMPTVLKVMIIVVLALVAAGIIYLFMGDIKPKKR